MPLLPSFFDDMFGNDFYHCFGTHVFSTGPGPGSPLDQDAVKSSSHGTMVGTAVGGWTPCMGRSAVATAVIRRRRGGGEFAAAVVVVVVVVAVVVVVSVSGNVGAAAAVVVVHTTTTVASSCGI